MLSIFGISVFVLIFGGMLRANARRWRYLAEHYATEREHTVETRHMQNAVLLGLGGFNSLKGIVAIGVNDAGVSLRIMPVFSLFHEPLFIPHSDIQGWGTSWYLDGSSSELQFKQAPDVQIVVPTETATWIKGFSGNQMLLRRDEPPAGKSGQGWRLFVLVHACMALLMMGWLAQVYMFGQLH